MEDQIKSKEFFDLKEDYSSDSVPFELITFNKD